MRPVNGVRERNASPLKATALLKVADLAFPDRAHVTRVTAADILPLAPMPMGRERAGLLPPDVTDPGLRQIDDLALVR